MEGIIYRELGIGVRNPEGVRDWVGERRDMGVLGRYLANREIAQITWRRRKTLGGLRIRDGDEGIRR